MEYMVSVFINRQRDHGYNSWYDVANAKQKDGTYQMEGYPQGVADLNNLGSSGDPRREQARRGVSAIQYIKQHGPFATTSTTGRLFFNLTDVGGLSSASDKVRFA